MLTSSSIISLSPSICDSNEPCGGVDVDDANVSLNRRFLYLPVFLLIASITDARANCKSTLPSVRTPLICFSTVFLILRYSPSLFWNQLTSVSSLDISLLSLSDSCLLRSHNVWYEFSKALALAISSFNLCK
jgi:hypothetical protein